VWLSVWSEVQLVCIWSSRCQYIQKPHHPLPHLNPDWFYLFGTGLSRSSWVRRGGYAGVIKQTSVQWVLKAPANARRYTSAVLAIALCPSIRLSQSSKKGKGSPYSITERRVSELFPVLGSQPADDVSRKPGGRLPLLSARPAVTLATIKKATTSFAAW